MCLLGYLNFDLLLIQNYDLFRRFEAHFVSGADLEKYWADDSHIAHTCSLFTSTGLILWNIMKTAQDIYTITRKQIVRFQERMHFEKIQLVQVQNGRQSAIIHFHMAVIW